MNSSADSASATISRTSPGRGTPVNTLMVMVKVRSSSASPIRRSDGSSGGTSL
jgi:hypothetical protein